MVTVRDVAGHLSLKVMAGELRLDETINGGYVGDLLSLVMAKTFPGNIWVTVQGHPNVVAVAALVGLSAVIVAEGAKVDPMTLRRADQEGVPILSAKDSAFNVVAHLVELGVKGSEC